MTKVSTIRNCLILAYSLFEGVLLVTSAVMWWIIHIETTKTLLQIGLDIIVLDIIVFGMCSSIFYSFFNFVIIPELYDEEGGARLAFIQTLITSIFLFSVAQSPILFYNIGLYWCIMSPIGILLSAGVYLVPFIRNRMVTTIVGAISAALGFASKFYTIPFAETINIPLTMAGALLTVIGVGSPPLREEDIITTPQ